ncbi:MAG TPA: type III pantothenate kinase [Candidatus Binatia bacterium]|nr:type III pantothenate kinase [Candidatus Binatia bacterium]
MLLVIDVGNTNTKVGVCDPQRVLVSWQLTTRREQTADEYGLFIETLLRTRGVGPGDVTGVAISNVVPQVQRALEEMAERYFGATPLFVGADLDAIPLDVEDPRSVGADRIVASVAAVALYGAPAIVVDLGTATRFDCVDARGRFIGGAIAPGVIVAADALLSRAARLFRVELVRPERAIGRDTMTNIQSGIVFGFAGLIDGLVARMREEMGVAATVIATGGMAPLMAQVARSIQHLNPDLKLEGLRLIHQRHGK